MVRVEQLPWGELDWGKEDMVCKAEGLPKNVEKRLRMTLYSWKNFKSDMVVLPEFTIGKSVKNASLGPDAKVERIGLSQHFGEQLKTIEEVESLETPTVEVDPVGDQQKLTLVQDLIGDILPVRLSGHLRHSGLWDMISTKISPERMLYDLADRPEYVEALIRKWVEMENGVLDQFEELGLLEAAPADIHCTGAFCDELPSKNYDGKKAIAKDTWTFSMAQMFSEVSPAMHEEYDILPLKPLLERYGLVYYGCCEPLHHKIDIIRNIKNVRKISISPWAKKAVAAEMIHGDFVFSAKPNPSFLAMTHFDENLVRKDLLETVGICRQHKTPCELILKDVSTVLKDPSRLTRWEQIAMEVVESA